jgi:hypothetical protein
VRPEEDMGFFSVLLGDAAFRRLLGGALGEPSVAAVPFSCERITASGSGSAFERPSTVSEAIGGRCVSPTWDGDNGG